MSHKWVTGSLPIVGFGVMGVVSSFRTGVLPGVAGSWPLILLGLAGLTLIPLRRRHPVAFGIVVPLLSAVAPLAAYVSVLAAYTAGAEQGRRTSFAVTAWCLVLAVWGVSRGVEPLRDRPGLAVVAVLLHLAAVAGGMLVRAGRAEQQRLRERAHRAEEEQARRVEETRRAERRRIAAEMHDALGHRLSLISVHAGALQARARLPATTVHETAGLVRTTTHAAMADLRDIVQVLRESVPERGGARPTLPGLDGLDELTEVAGAAGTPTVLALGPEAHDAADVPGDIAYRVVREGLTNARRHRPGAAVRVRVDGLPGGGLDVEIRTAPAGADADPGEGPGARTGLVGLRERIATLTGGTLEHHTDDDGTHVLHAVVPWSTYSVVGR